MSFNLEPPIPSTPPEKYYPNENARIKGLAKEEIYKLLDDKEFLILLKEKLKEIKD